MRNFLISLLYSNLILLAIIGILYPRRSSEEFYEDLTAYQNLICPEVKMLNQPNIKLDERYSEFSLIDNVFFASGETPLYMLLSFWGIQPGEKWSDIDPKYLPISGNYILKQTDDRHWEYHRDDLSIILTVTSDRFRVAAFYIVGSEYYSLFIVKSGGWPFLTEENYLSTFADNHFYGGFVAISWMKKNEAVSIEDAAAKIVIGDSNKNFFAGIAVDSETSTYRISRLEDGTCIKIRVDKSFTPE